MIYRLAPSVVRNLADSAEGQLGPVAEQWAQTEEFFGQGDAAVLTDLIVEMASLARQAEHDQKAVYCWLSV